MALYRDEQDRAGDGCKVRALSITAGHGRVISRDHVDSRARDLCFACQTQRGYSLVGCWEERVSLQDSRSIVGFARGACFLIIQEHLMPRANVRQDALRAA